MSYTQPLSSRQVLLFHPPNCFYWDKHKYLWIFHYDLFPYLMATLTLTFEVHFNQKYDLQQYCMPHTLPKAHLLIAPLYSESSFNGICYNGDFASIAIMDCYNYQNSSSTEYNIVVDEPNKAREERYHIVDHSTTGTPFFCQLNLCIYACRYLFRV
jgi:hypothetical protein